MNPVQSIERTRPYQLGHSETLNIYNVIAKTHAQESVTNLRPVLAVIYYNLVVITAGNKCVALRREVDAVYNISVFSKHFRCFKGFNNLIC